MRVAGLPLWALVLVACIVAPLVIRVWIEAEERRAKRRTASVLQAVTRDRVMQPVVDGGSGTLGTPSGPEDAASQAQDLSSRSET